MMERQQAAQEEKLVKIRMEMDSLEVVHQARDSLANRRGCFRCTSAVATMLGLVVVALVVFFILHYFMFMPSCNQDPQTPGTDIVKVYTTYKLKRRDEQGTYDILTVDESTTYLVYGWVKFLYITSEEIIMQMQDERNQKRTIEKKKVNKEETFFFSKVSLNQNFTISVHFKSQYIDSLFHVYKL